MGKIANQLVFRFDSNLEKFKQGKLDARRINIIKSPKKGGSSDIDSIPYQKDLGVEITKNAQHIQFAPNINEHIHRWAPYVQGFSSSFVQSILDRYKTDYKNPTILDPFAGCGTVLVQGKLNGYKSFGTELNPLLHFIADTKLNCWDISPNYLLKIYNEMPQDNRSPAPTFLKSHSQFNEGVLNSLEIIKEGIESIKPKNEKQRVVKNLINLAFSSIIIECSNLTRSPCLGYCRNKKVNDKAPLVLLNQKIHDIADDLKVIQSQYKESIKTESKVILTNASEYEHNNQFDLVITSPPYTNGMDYVMNYKIEMR